MSDHGAPVERKNRLFIGGISDRVHKEDIEREFGRFGQLNNVWVAQNPPGFAFVEFDHISEADMAVQEMNGKSFLGSSNKIRVEHSYGGRNNQNRNRPRMSRGPPGGGGGYSSGPRERYNSGSSYDGGYRGNSNGYSNGGSMGRRDYNGGGGGGGRYDNSDRRRVERRYNNGQARYRNEGGMGGGGGSYGGRGPSYNDGGNGYGRNRSRSPPPYGGGRSKYGGRNESFSPVPGTYLQNPGYN